MKNLIFGLKTLTLYIVVLSIIVLIVFLPKSTYNIASVDEEPHYKLNTTDYWEQINSYGLYVLSNKSLGETNFGVSVEEEVGEYLPRSLYVLLTAFLITFLFGVSKGVLDFINQKNVWGKISKFITFSIHSVPDFFLIICIQWLIILYIPMFNEYVFGYEGWKSFILPAIIVSVYPTLYISDVTMKSLNDEREKLYVKYARSKGLSKWYVLKNHMFRNCASKIFSHTSSLTFFLLSNLLMIEYLMDYKGIAFRLYQAINFKDALYLGSTEEIEAGVIIGISLCFMAIILISQTIGYVGRRLFEPKRVVKNNEQE